MTHFWTTGRERNDGFDVYISPMERLWMVAYDLDGDALVSGLFFYDGDVSTQASFVCQADRIAA